MNSITTMRHYGKFKGEEIIVLGYRKSRNSCLIVRVAHLPGDDQVQLRMIASSPEAQKRDYLINVLTSVPHRSGKDWFTYLSNLTRNKTVMDLPLKDIEDLEQGQKAFFKGYGPSVETGAPQTPTKATAYSGGNDIDNEVLGLDESVTAETSAPVEKLGIPDRSYVQAAPAGTDPTLLAILAQVVEGQKAIINSLNDLTKASKPPKRGRKVGSTTKKAVAAEDVESAA